ncbi:MAG TPA: cyclophilin-like family protein [Candidatus Nanopelagicaceae bacterium]|nr:cyclophilin-like family protein [Candidatus Nanopelagicaceae bacterium]
MSMKIKIDLFGIGTINGEMIRYYAPLSADAIINKLPIVLRGRFSFGSKVYWTLPGIEIYKGINPKSNKNVEKGDIIYNPKSDELIFILENTELQTKVNKIGKVTENLEFFLQAKNGLNTKISKMKS